MLLLLLLSLSSCFGQRDVSFFMPRPLQVLDLAAVLHCWPHARPALPYFVPDTPALLWWAIPAYKHKPNQTK